MVKLIHYYPVVYIERQLSRELTHFQADKYEHVTVFGWNEDGKWTRKIPVSHPNDNLDLILLPGINLKLIPQVEKYPILFGTSQVLAANSFDILHLNSHLNLQSHQFLRRAKQLKKKTVITIHGTIGYYSRAINRAQELYLRFLQGTLFRNVDQIICLTQTDKHDLESIGVPEGKMKIVPNGVNEDFFIPGNELPNPTVVWHGRFIPQKGLPDLIRSVDIIRNEVADVQFRILGWGPQESLISHLIDHRRLNSCVHLLGKQPWKDVPGILAGGHVYAMPSYHEGMPFSLLESMACGTPAVAYSIRGIHDIIDHGVDGYLVEPGNYNALGKFVAKLLTDHNLRIKMGIKARKKVEAYYSWKQIANRYDEIYQDVISL